MHIKSNSFRRTNRKKLNEQIHNILIAEPEINIFKTKKNGNHRQSQSRSEYMFNKKNNMKHSWKGTNF